MENPLTNFHTRRRPEMKRVLFVCLFCFPVEAEQTNAPWVELLQVVTQRLPQTVTIDQLGAATRNHSCILDGMNDLDAKVGGEEGEDMDKLFNFAGHLFLLLHPLVEYIRNPTKMQSAFWRFLGSDGENRIQK